MSSTLDERGRRRWCAAEARSHGRGGIAAVARVTGVSRRTIDRGLLVRRESHDYYGHSVTMGLAPRRRSRVRRRCTSERDVGVPLISLIALTGQRSTPRRLRRPHTGCRRRAWRQYRMSFRRTLPFVVWRLGFKQSSLRLITRVPRRLGPDI